jgi:hypothetical protein
MIIEKRGKPSKKLLIWTKEINLNLFIIVYVKHFLFLLWNGFLNYRTSNIQHGVYP